MHGLLSWRARVNKNLLELRQQKSLYNENTPSLLSQNWSLWLLAPSIVKNVTHYLEFLS
jgi:hypothetical protein